MATPNSPPSSTSADADPSPDNITLRIVVLAHGNRAEDDLYLVLGLDTTVGQLKQRIQDSLSQRPPPELQRLIYHGRPLLDTSVTLRHTLRLDQRMGSSSHVLHLVIRDDASSTLPTDSRAAQHAANIHPRPQLVQPTQPLPHQHHVHLPAGVPNLDHMRIHNQLHNIQHQLHHAQATNRANQARLQAQQARLQAQPPTQIPTIANGLPFPPQIPNIQHPPNLPGHQVRGQTPQPQAQAETSRIEERIGPNGEHIRTTTSNNGTTSMTFRVTGLNAPNPLDRPSSAPSLSPSPAQDPANRGTNALPPNIQIHAHLSQPPHLPHIPSGLPFPPGMQLPIPFPSLMPQHLYNQMMPGAMGPTQSQPMAWLLSSPQGPQGIVFAPGHGYFSTLPTITTLPSQSQQQNTHMQPTSTTTTQQPPPPAAQQNQLIARPQDGQPPPPQPGARPQPPAQHHPHPALAQPARPANRNPDNEFLNLLLTRAWLFLRLYMFVFVLSESGTWRRIFMLGSAIIFCLLPRQNPFTQGLQAARRHFDNLIGPPNIPERQGQDAGQAQNQQGQGQGNAAATPGSRQQQNMPTPEEAARRLLAAQHRRNPNPIVDYIYRIEQGVVLFLASLIPGLGERHIQVREQARRILEEEERRVREETERAQAETDTTEGLTSHQQAGESEASGDGGGTADSKTEGGPLPASWGATTTTPPSGNAGDGGTASASSSGINRNAGADEQAVRSRNTGA